MAINKTTICVCGCGGHAKNQFIRGHNLRRQRPLKHYATAPNRASHSHFYLHRQTAEAALGHPLPPKAVVHHVDGTLSEQSRLVICQNQKYHFLLHVRMRVKAAGGNPNTDRICYTCHQVKPIVEFTPFMSQAEKWMACKPCRTRLNREYKARRRVA